MGDFYVHACASAVGSQRRWQLRKPEIVHDIRIRPECHFSDHGHHHGDHAGFHIAEAEDRLADKVLRRSHHGARFAVSRAPIRHLPLQCMYV